MTDSALDETHDRRRWRAGSNRPTIPATDFPIQNLPFGRFRPRRASLGASAWRSATRCSTCNRPAWPTRSDMNQLMAAGSAATPRRCAWRCRAACARGGAARARFASGCARSREVEMGLPCQIGDYTDFYTGIHHATTVGKLFRPDNPLLPNYKWVPIGYHGRASSIGVSGQSFHRPLGQTKAAERRCAGARPEPPPRLRAGARRLRRAAERAGRSRSRSTTPRSTCSAWRLFNDWSARDIQAWEYQPLGPFLSKNFASTLSPWIVTLEALAAVPQRLQRGPPATRDPLPYLDSPANRERGAHRHRARGLAADAGDARRRPCRRALEPLELSPTRYWTLAQLVAHHTVNGCNLQSGRPVRLGHAVGPGRRTGRLAAGAERGRQAAAAACPTARRAASSRTATP